MADTILIFKFNFIFWYKLWTELGYKHFLLSLTHVMVGKVLFWCQFFEKEIYTLWGTLNPKNHILSIRFVCICVNVAVISITQKQITANTPNMVFYVSIMYRCYLKLFIKIEQKLCVQGLTKELWYIKAYVRNFVLRIFRMFRLR